MKICAGSIFILLHNSSLKKVLKFHVLSQNFKYKLFRPAFVFQYQDTMVMVRKNRGVRWKENTNFSVTFRS